MAVTQETSEIFEKLQLISDVIDAKGDTMSTAEYNQLAFAGMALILKSYKIELVNPELHVTVSPFRSEYSMDGTE